MSLNSFPHHHSTPQFTLLPLHLSLRTPSLHSFPCSPRCALLPVLPSLCTPFFVPLAVHSFLRSPRCAFLPVLHSLCTPSFALLAVHFFPCSPRCTLLPVLPPLCTPPHAPLLCTSSRTILAVHSFPCSPRCALLPVLSCNSPPGWAVSSSIVRPSGFFFSYLLYFRPFSVFSVSLLNMLIFRISMLQFLCASVLENTCARVPHFL